MNVKTQHGFLGTLFLVLKSHTEYSLFCSIQPYMERSNSISVDAPLNFIAFSTSGKSLYEFHPIKYVGWVPNSIGSPHPAGSPIPPATVKVEFGERSTDDVVDMTWFRSHIIDNIIFIWLLLYFPFMQDSAYDWSRAFVLTENDSLFKERVSSLFECDFVWFSIGVSISADLFLRGFLQSFSRFSHLPLPLMKIFPSIFEEKRMSGWIWVQIVAIAVKTVSYSRLEADMDGSTT